MNLGLCMCILIVDLCSIQLGHPQVQHGGYGREEMLFHRMTSRYWIPVTDGLNEAIVKHDNTAFGMAADHAFHTNTHGLFKRCP